MKQTFDALKESLHVREELLRAAEEVAGVAVENWTNLPVMAQCARAGDIDVG